MSPICEREAQSVWNIGMWCIGPTVGAVHSPLRSGQIYTTTSMTIQFVRALPPSQHRVRCEGRAVHTGARVATAEGRLFDASGRLLAPGSETCLIVDAAKDHR
jgi:uncharacterized protein (TIGR00369 family)